MLGLVVQTGCHRLPPNPASWYLTAPFVAAGASEARGRFEALLSERQRSVFLDFEGLPPNAPFFVLVGDELLASITSDADGRSAAHATIDVPRLDPRGQRIVVVDAAGTEVLELAGPGHPGRNEAEWAPLGAFAPGAASIVTMSIGATVSSTVYLGGAEPGRYEVVVDGTSRAPLDAAADGRGQATIEPADFDPYAAAIEVSRDGVAWWAGSGRAQIEGLDFCSTGLQQQAFVATQTGAANATLRTRVDCSRRFDLEVSGVPMGDYDVLVGDVVRGTIAVGLDENGDTIGWLGFSNASDGANQLDFEPVGQRIAIAQGAALYFDLAVFAP
jgi:hypothetical protein